MRAIVAFFALFSVAVSADWNLDPENSSLNFISTKNTHFSEMHSFDSFSGSLTASGELSVNVNLASVNTLIEIRDTRMREMLFKVSEFSTATFKAQLPQSVLGLKNGEARSVDVSGELSLHGASVPVTANVRVAKLSDLTLTAHTTKPIILNANQFGLEAGVEALQKIAGLSNISLAVPVSFSVTFTQ